MNPSQKISPIENPPDTPCALPLPRLIVRVGGLGNLKFGRDKGIDDPPEQMRAAAESACVEVWSELEAILTGILHDDQDHALGHWPEPPPRWKTHFLARLFGTSDRWELEARSGLKANAFTSETPLIKLLTGDAQGADEWIRDTAKARTLARGAGAEYHCLPIVAKAPTTITDGLGVGDMPPKLPDTEATVLTRHDAQVRAGIARQRAYAFRAQGEALRHHSDVLLAIWDPDTEGKAGGTTETVAAALLERLPVIAIILRGGETTEIHFLQSLEELHAVLPPPTSPPSTDWKLALSNALKGTLSFPDPIPDHAALHTGEQTTYHPRNAFAIFRENKTLPPLWLGWCWRTFETLTKKKSPQTENKKAAAVIHDTFQEFYEPIRRRASSTGMSGLYGDAHRGGIVMSYVLAALAVLLAVTGAIAHSLHAPALVLQCLAILEFVAIAVMWALSECSRIEDWSGAWTDSRILAEALRVMEFLGPMGVHTPLPRRPLSLRDATGITDQSRSWSLWYFRALIRMAPLRFKSPLGHNLNDLRNAVLEQACKKQISHHQKNEQKQHRLHVIVEQRSFQIFMLVGACAVIHLIDVSLPHHIPFFWMLSLLIGVVGPALISAMHGLASQIEVLRLQDRSEGMVTLLKERQRLLEELELISNPVVAGSLKRLDLAEPVWGLTTQSLVVASIMMEETAGWSMLCRDSDIHVG